MSKLLRQIIELRSNVNPSKATGHAIEIAAAGAGINERKADIVNERDVIPRDTNGGIYSAITSW